MKSLIISGANRQLFDKALLFLKSLKKNGYDGDVILCDNAYKKNILGKIRINKNDELTVTQKTELESYSCKIITISELLMDSNADMHRISNIHTMHNCHPFKTISCSLIARKYKGVYDRIAYCDIDMYFQDKFNLNFIISNNIYFGLEGIQIGKTKIMSQWMGQISMPSRDQGTQFLEIIQSAPNVCAGFFAGFTTTFLNFTELMWNLSEVKSLKFHNDQPLVNYILHWLKIPFSTIEWETVCHMAYVPENEFQISGNQIVVRNLKPSLIHYHGPHGSKLYNALKENTISCNAVQ